MLVIKRSGNGPVSQHTQILLARRFFTMSSATVYRLCGIVLLIGGILAALGQMQDFSGSSASLAWIATGLLTLIGNILEFLGLPGIAARQAQRAGWLGMIGFLLFFSSGLLLGVAFPLLMLIIVPWMASIPALSQSAGPPALTSALLAAATVNLVGTLVFAIATLRARVFPRWPAILLIVSIVLNFVSDPLGLSLLSATALAVFHLSLAWFGFVLCFRTAGIQEPVPSPHSFSDTSVRV
jgi:hypothetical protein